MKSSKHLVQVNSGTRDSTAATLGADHADKLARTRTLIMDRTALARKPNRPMRQVFARIPGAKAMSTMSRQRRYQLRHKRASMCYDCSRLTANGTLFCEMHRRKRNLRNREWQRERFKRKIRYQKAESYKFKPST